MTLSELKNEYRIVADSDDPWGSAMGVMFDLCAELWNRGEPSPVLWKTNYSPGAAGAGFRDPRNPESYWFEMFAECDAATLEKFGLILNRYLTNLSRLGMDY